MVFIVSEKILKIINEKINLTSLKDFDFEKDKSILFSLFLDDKLSFKDIIKNFNINKNNFLKDLSKYLNVKFFEINDEKLINIFPIKVLLDFKFLPIKQEQDVLYIAFLKKYDLETLEFLQNFIKDYFINVCVFNPLIIEQKLNNLYIKYKINDLEDKLNEELSINSNQENQTYVEKIFNFIIKEAINKNASDIHIEANFDDALIRFRIDGVLNHFYTLKTQSYQALNLYLKFLANLNVAERRNAQDGSFVLKINDLEYDFRISTLPLIYGESIVIRILRKDINLINLDKLDFCVNNLKLLKSNLNSSNGLILVTGPTGSGKSTTLYACLNYLQSMEKKIISAEDPIEYKLNLVQQILLNKKAGLEFNNALRAILRQDPDIIMIGEIRDEESLDIAIKASLTGHLVLSTLHTNDAISSIIRLFDMQAKPYLIASSLKLIIAQRLCKKLCPHCKIKSDKKYENIDFITYESKGCEFCNNSGVLGRELISEFLFIDENIKEMIRLNKNKDEILTYAKNNGFLSMEESALTKVKNSLISMEEFLRVLK